MSRHRSESLGPLRVQQGDERRRSKRSSSGTRNGNGRSSSEGRTSSGIGISSMGRNTGIPKLSGRPSTGRPSTGYQSLGRPSTGLPSYGGGAASHRAVSRMSSMGQKNLRHSSIGGRGRSTVTKECRPISEKSFQHKCIKRLGEFLIEQGYPCSISNKGLQSPTNKDFYKIFEFIYSFIVPDVKINKPDEDIPRIFKQIGYPLAISKSSMFAVGTPHTWPGLLAGLVWLMELVELQFTLLNQDNGEDGLLFTCDDDFDSMSEDKLLYLYTEKTYTSYLNGEDDFESFDQALSRAIKAKYCGGSTATDPLSDISRLQQELELLEQDSDMLKKLQEQKNDMETDMHRMTDYLNKLESFKNTMKHQNNEAIDDVNESVEKKRSLEEKYQNMQIICEQQKMTQADIHRMKLRRQELQSQTDNLDKENENLDKYIWKLETDVAKSREKIEKMSRDYNSRAHTLKLIPITGENSNGLDYEMKTSHYSTMADDDENLRVALLEFKKRCNSDVRDDETSKLKQQTAIEMLRETVSEAEEENKSVEKNIKKKEEEIDVLKQMNQRELEMVKEEIDKEQNMILELKKQSHLGTQEALKDLHEHQKQCEEERLELDKILKKGINMLNELVDHVVNGMTRQREQIADMVSHSEGILNQMMELEDDEKEY